jgi:hypothetical protein
MSVWLIVGNSVQTKLACTEVARFETVFRFRSMLRLLDPVLDSLSFQRKLPII